MLEDDRVQAVKQLLFEHVKSPSLRHIKDPYVLIKLAQQIVNKLDRGNSMWTKWSGLRDQLAQSAVPCWIPVSDLRDHLNRMEGPRLTLSDVEQRLRAFEEERYSEFPRDEFQTGCLAIYEAEKAEGTELPAIVGVLRAHIESEEARLEQEHRDRYAKLKEEQRLAAEQRLLSGADCKWTPWAGTKDLYCRVGGRLFRLAPRDDKFLDLFRVEEIDSSEGHLLGRYMKRGDATKAVERIAYQPETHR
ncbi:hypothetical protein HZY97_08395 [Sphingomonas sp. R-74633]|uniref:hypothetical protein n=1 Tax=Sphingomonas sp. R-74633 TaxID=2751188 RepID=UPI0015D1CEA6|nr:hypothetical protein [Sphingomonas sp. R-74633]NYT40772.1 hypothetical protein [Sphingomonas sp. R-74633]